MKVEVGRLTRNILIQGTRDDINYHGGHFMIHGKCEDGIFFSLLFIHQYKNLF
jgi:hypothetical protein